MPTVFRTTATLPDATGRYRTALLLATRRYGDWKPGSIADFIKRQQLPTRALTVTDSEYDALEADSALCFGYVDAPGDTETDFKPSEWSRTV